MPLALHGLVEAHPRAERISLLAPEAVLQAWAGTPLIAISTPFSEDSATVHDPEVEIRRALHHHDLLAKVSTEIDVVPVRFGTVFSGPVAMGEHLRSHCDENLAVMERLAGKVEMSFRVERSTGTAESRTASDLSGALPQHEAELSGRAYLKLKKGLREERTLAARTRSGMLLKLRRTAISASHAVAYSEPRSDTLLNMSVLIARAGVATFTANLESLASEAACSGFRIIINGPWPAYSFCGDPEDAAPAQCA